MDLKKSFFEEKKELRKILEELRLDEKQKEQKNQQPCL